MINRKSVLPQTLLALTLSSLCATAVAANLRAGAARVDITPCGGRDESTHWQICA
jgi:hypothetical protein